MCSEVVRSPGTEVPVDQVAEVVAHPQARPRSAQRIEAHSNFDAVMGPEDSDLAGRLLESARAGDHQAFARLVRIHEQQLSARLYRLLDDPRDVEEALQDTFVAAWQHLDGHRGDAALSTWLYRIATNVALMSARRRRPLTVPLADASEQLDRMAVDPIADTVGHVEVARPRAALAALPTEQRIVVVLRDVEGLSAAEVAQHLDITVAATKTRLHRGRMTLRKILARRTETARRFTAPPREDKDTEGGPQQG